MQEGQDIQVRDDDSEDDQAPEEESSVRETPGGATEADDLN